MDKSSINKPVDPEILRMMLNRIDGALSLLENSIRLADSFGPNISCEQETLTSLLRPVLYSQAYERCIKGEVEVYGDFIPKIIAKDIKKEDLIKKYIQETKK